MDTLAEDDVRKYAIAGSSILAGVVSLLNLAVPKGWSLTQGVAPFEVDAHMERSGRKWVTAGRATYTVTTASGGALDFTLDVRKGRDAKSSPWTAEKPDATKGQRPVGGHEAAYGIAGGTRGLLRKTPVHVVRVALYCDATGRTLRMEFVGPCSLAEVETLLAGLEWCRCH